jgi:hypothetical protein
VSLHTVSTPVPPLPASAGQWINVTSDAASLVQLGICIGFLQSSTGASHGNSNAGQAYHNETALQRNLEAKRATVWLWQDEDGNSLLTIVFHASDGNPAAAVTAPRFFVCAGLDPSLSSSDAYTLLGGAVSQFVNINNIPRDKIFLMTEKGNPPKQGDLIHDLFITVTQNDFHVPHDESFDNRRFPKYITTYQLK